MLSHHHYHATFHFSAYALDPDTPDTEYEVHVIKTSDPGYVPPDQEAWPLYYPIILKALEAFPGALDAVIKDVTAFCAHIRGRRVLEPFALNTTRLPNQPNSLPRLTDLGSRT